MAECAVPKSSTETYQDLVERLNAADPPGSAQAKKSARIARRVVWMCRQASWAPETTKASYPAARQFFATHTPAAFGVTAGTYAVYRSEVLSVLKPAAAPKRRYILMMTGVYRQVYDLTAQADADLPQAFRWRSSQFLWYLHDLEIPPSSITSDTLIGYYEFCRDVQMLEEGAARDRARNAATYVSLLASHPSFKAFGFSPVAISFPNRSIKYNVPPDIAHTLLQDFDARVVPWARGEVSNRGETWSEYIARLDAAEVPASASDKKAAWKAGQAYQSLMASEEQLSRGAATGFLPSSRRWVPATIQSRRDLCATCAKIMYEAGGFHIETIEELTDPEILEAIAKRLLARRSETNPQSAYTSNIMTFVTTLARDFVARPQDDLDTMRALKARYGRKRTGIAPKNKETLRKFTEPRIQALVDMPDQILRDVNRQVQQRREAHRHTNGTLPRPAEVYNRALVQQVMLALAAHIMLARAPRRSNLAALRLDWIRWRDGLAMIEIPPQFVKSRRERDGPLLIPLNDRTSRLLDQYLTVLRPQVLHQDDAQNPHLFPSPPHAGQLRLGGYYATLPDRLVDEVHRRVGVRINPHLWRHLLGWIWLKEDPDKLSAVQKLLGHQNIQTTINYYADIDESVALQEWSGYLDGKKTHA